MGTRKWRLDSHESYAKDLIVLRLLHLIDAEANLSDGPFMVYREAAVDGWDDIVEVGSREGSFYARHYQVKHQYGDFTAKTLKSGGAGGPAENFMLLFDQAHAISMSPGTYDDVVVPSDRIEFVVCLPTDDVKVDLAGGGLSIRDLRTLRDECNSSSATQIGSNKGANLTDGQRGWLEAVAARFSGDYAQASNLVARMKVDLWPESVLQDELNSVASRLFGLHKLAKSHILYLLGRAVPEGAIRVHDLLSEASALEPRPLLKALTICSRDGLFWTRGVWGDSQTVDTPPAHDHVRKVWSMTGPAALRIGFRPGEEFEETRVVWAAAIRLLAHLPCGPHSVCTVSEWFELARWLTGFTVGCGAGQNAELMKANAYQEFRPTLRPKPSTATDAATLANTLHDAMDRFVSEEVDIRVKQRGWSQGTIVDASVAAAKALLFAEQANLLRRVLKGWWEPEQVDGRLRLGPRLLEGVVDVVLSLATLARAFPETPTEIGSVPAECKHSITRIRRMPVRALALETAAQKGHENRGKIRPLSWYGADLLSPPGIVLVRNMDVGYVMRNARPKSITTVVGFPALSTTSPSGVLISMQALLSESDQGEVAVVNFVSDEIAAQQGVPAKATFESAIEAWKEQEDAA